MQNRHVFTSESVSEGHPDKVADQISDAVLDACLKKDRHAHVACETLCATDLVVNAGEITCKDFDKIDVAKPVSICVKTFGTLHGTTNAELEKMLLSGAIFDFRPWALIRDLGLLAPKGWSYRDTASYGHFGRASFPWEKLNRVAKLKAWAKTST